MGNASSNSDSDDEFNTEDKEEELISDGELDTEKDGHLTVDLAMLFDHTALRTTASKIRDDMPENIVQQHHGHLVRWLEDRHSRGEESVSLGQFCDMLMARSVGREECVKAFQQFDSEGDNTADVGTMLESLRQSNGANMNGELANVIRTLQACSLTPGFIDVYTESSHCIGHHGSRILNFLLRNRAPSTTFPFPMLEGFNNTAHMRLAVLQALFNKLKESADKSMEDSLLSSGEELKLISKCYTSLEVSTNKSDAHRLTNGEFDSYWQSDGSARSHWIRLRMKNNVVIKLLSVAVSSSDQSYMPQLITVSVGKNVHSLREIKEVRIPSHISNDVVLLENAKMHYPIVQINIRRCHSDGCDTRIHGIKTLGLKIVKESGLSVTDASAVWFLQVLASTATTCIPMAPQLRTAILEHSKTALKHMAPLALAPNSNEKPSFLSSHVLKQMDTFLTEMAVTQVGYISSDALYVLLAFNLARGHVAGVLKTLKLVQESMNDELYAASLMKSMTTVRDAFWKKQGNPLTLTLCGCDGGQKLDTSGPENVLLGNWNSSTQVYLSGDGKTKVNMFFKGSDRVQITRIKIKVEKGPRGAKQGFVFVFKDSDKEFDIDKHVQRFNFYDTWGFAEYCLCNNIRSAGIGGKPDNPVAHFAIEEEWDEIEVPLDVYPVGQYVLIKFLGPRQPSAERLGIVGVRFYGFTRKAVFAEELDMPKQVNLSRESDMVSVNSVFIRTLSFLVDLAREQNPSRKSQTKPQALDMSELSMDTMWKLYSAFQQETEQGIVCRVLMLQLLHALFSTLSSAKQTENELFFKHLCDLVNNAGLVKTDDKNKRYHLKMAEQVIVDGAAVLFPDKEARRKQLFNMMDTVTGNDEKPSASLIFQSLCQFYSSVEPSGLLDLPNTVKGDFDPSPVVAVMETLISVAFKEFQSIIDHTHTLGDASHLVHLLCSLQSSMLAWCLRQLTNEDCEHEDLVTDLIVRYFMLLSEKTGDACKVLFSKDETTIQGLMNKIEKTFLATAVREGILILTLMSDHLTSTARVTLLHCLMSVTKEMRSLAPKLPSLFHTITSEHWQQVNTENVTLRTWEVESPHNYENNLRTTQIFSCPGATTFVVDFDPRCETEKKYDYLEFTDSHGVKTRYDQKVGTEKWPKQVTFRGGHRLQFMFHSDSSNNEWGYKFKVTAFGTPDSPLSWIFDLQLGLSKLLGKLCGCTLNLQKLMPKKPDPEKLEEDPEATLLKSDLWTTLFRGGYMVGKLQRSLSGKHAADAGDSAITGFLWDIVIKEEGEGETLVKKCQENSHSHQLGGGAELELVVRSVFAALLWHTQPLREELEKQIVNESSVNHSDCIQQAYNTAETLRVYLIDQRQKQKLAEEKEGVLKQSERDPALDCAEKAQFLLKFAGLSKVHLKQEIKPNKAVKGAKKLQNRKLSLESDRYKYDPVSEKYPAFRLVMEFVRNSVWSRERVQHLLQERSKQAQAVSEVYMFAAEYIRIMADEHIFQIPTVLFLQELLCQQNSFPKHYLDWLDGCGLELESKVRQAYYTLIRKLLDAVQNFKKHKEQVAVCSAYEFIQACLLHLLDMNWQLYDLAFVADVKLPLILINIAKGSVTTRDKSLSEFNEEQELSDYTQCMAWFEECKDGFIEWYGRVQNASPEDRKARQMFVARFSDLLDVEISCDGCHITLPGRRYRCLQCQDMDLCATCYSGGVNPGGEHTDEHDIVHLMYKCDECQAFIAGQRIHCDVCEDFDLCFGCNKNKLYPPSHDADHPVTIYPMVKLKLNNKNDSSLQAYIHQHVWLLSTQLTLSLADIIYNTGSFVDTDYSQTALKLHCQCIEMVTDCLKQVPEGDQHVTVEENDSEEAVKKRQEVSFAVHSQERIMGLLGAMIPPESKVLSDEVSHSFHTEEFLRLLFTIARGDSAHESNTQHLAMGLISQLLKRSSTTCQSVDQAVTAAINQPYQGDLPTGQQTVQFLFNFGATCLERSGLEWACSMSSILQDLFNTHPWRDVLLTHITERLQELKDTETPELSSIFALFVIAGFPEVLSIGSHVKCSESGVEAKDGVVLKHFPDKRQTLIIDKKTRKRRTVKDEYVECVTHDVLILDEQHLSTFISIIEELIRKYKTGATISVENIWVLSLALKALHKTVNNSEGINSGSELFSTEFVQCLIHVAGQGTGFSKQWMLRDLEVLSLMLYTHDIDKSSDSKVIDTKTIHPVVTPDTPVDNLDPWEGLDETAKVCFQTLNDHLGVPVPVLRAIYDMHGQNTNNLLMSVHENLEDGSFQPTDEIKRLAKKWENTAKSVMSEVMADRVIDMGIQNLVLPKHVKRVADKAVEEMVDTSQKFITIPDNDLQMDIIKQRRSKSASLLKKELETQGKVGSRDYLKKVNLAMSVLWSRQVLLSLLADWPEDGHPITSELLGCKNSANIPCILDLFNRSENKTTFQKVVRNIIHHCDVDCLVPIAMTPCQFMDEVCMTSITRESKHNYNNNTTEQDKVHIPGAAYLSVKFDPRCSTEKECDELEIASTPDFKQDRHVISGAAKEYWKDFDIPGDTLYYKFKSDLSNNDWGYRFTVSGGKLGRFDTGYMILNEILANETISRNLPLDDLWSSLVYVACNQTGVQRLKTIQLLLRIVQTYLGQPIDGATASPSCPLDLSLLKPLWKLYKTWCKDADYNNCTVSLTRALTELFLLVENLALELGISEEYVASLYDIDEVKQAMFQGLRNVAAIGLALSIPNKASDAFMKTKDGDKDKK